MKGEGLRARKRTENDDKLGQVLAQVFDRLGLSRSRRPSRRTAALHVKRRRQREDASICERRNNKSPVIALVFEGVLERRLGLLGEDVAVRAR